MTDDAPRAGAEAAKLLAAAQEWLRESAPHLAPVDGAGQTCSCPVCRGIVRLRDGDPETVARWVDGAVAAFERLVADGVGASPAAPASDEAAAPAEGAVPPDGPDPAESGRTPRRVRRVPLDDPSQAPTSTADPAPQPPAREE